jgi:tRNA(Ile2) C34 agmatinyltransferase TiaS
MASRNDITGDIIKSRINNKQFEDNFDAIFKEKDPLCNVCGKSLSAKGQECAWTSCPLNWDESRVDIIGQNGNIGYEEEK